MEIIKDSKYFVDIEGNVYNPLGKKLVPVVTKKGYHHVKVVIKGKMKTMKVHRLVAQTYIDNPENKPFVNHIDGNKQNNSLCNLEWVTPKENSLHAVEVLGIGRGATHSQVLHSEEIIHKICKLLQENYRNIDIAKELNVPRELISRIRMGKNWKDISCFYNINPSRRANISDETVTWICKKLEEGLSSKEIIRLCESPITKHTVSKIRNKKIRPHITGRFKF